MKYSNNNAVQPIARHEDFVTNNETLRGQWANGYANRGHLPAEHWDVLHSLVKDNHVYVVYSYATPIAWWTDQAGWTIPEVKYSATTSRHQSIVRRAS